MRRFLILPALILIAQISYTQSNKSLPKEINIEQTCTDEKLFIEDKDNLIDDINDQPCFDHSMEVVWFSIVLLTSR